MKTRRSRVSTTRKHRGGAKPTQASFDSIMKKMLEVLTLVRLYHWNTFSYATHKATDDLYGSLSDHIDNYAETMLGKSDGAFRINMANYRTLKIEGVTNNQGIIKCVKRLISDLNKFHSSLPSSEYNDLHNIRDEIIGTLNKFLYLLTLK
jgi:DNA-binding ferritin-like protein